MKKSKKSKGGSAPAQPSTHPPPTEQPQWCRDLAAANARLNPGRTPPPNPTNKVTASGTGFETAAKQSKGRVVDPELQEIADILGLSPCDVLLLAEQFPAQWNGEEQERTP